MVETCWNHINNGLNHPIHSIYLTPTGLVSCLGVLGIPTHPRGESQDPPPGLLWLHLRGLWRSCDSQMLVTMFEHWKIMENPEDVDRFDRCWLSGCWWNYGDNGGRTGFSPDVGSDVHDASTMLSDAYLPGASWKWRSGSSMRMTWLKKHQNNWRYCAAITKHAHPL